MAWYMHPNNSNSQPGSVLLQGKLAARNAERAAGQTAQDSTAYTYAGADQQTSGGSGNGSNSRGESVCMRY